MYRAITLLALASTPALASEAVSQPLDSTGHAADDSQLSRAELLELALPGLADAPTIINGTEATPDQWPMSGGLLAQVDVTAFGSDLTAVLFTCSSTLIAPDVVLTAAHCIDQSLLEEQTGGIATINHVTYAWTPETDLSGYGIGGPSELPDHATAGWDLTLHPQWVGARGVQVGIAQNHDIALLFLDEPVLDRPHAYLPLPSEAAQIVTDAPVEIAGWGNQLPVPPGQQPQPGRVGIKHVAQSTIGAIGDTEFQVGVGAESSRKCQGDSGGPTFLQVESDRAESWRVIGATSHTWDEDLCENTGGVDTRVDYYLDWIDAEMRDRCADGSRSWCDVHGIIEPPLADPPNPDDSGDDRDEERRACGCSSTVGASGALPALLVLLGLVARRRT